MLWQIVNHSPMYSHDLKFCHFSSMMVDCDNDFIMNEM